MPLSNKLEIDPVKRASTFDHTQETATPSYYSVDLNDYDIHAELTGLSRAGIMQFCFEQDGDHYIVIEPNSDEGVAFVEIDPEKKEITGYNPVHRIYQGYGKEAGFSGHFVIQLNEEIADYGVWDSTTITPGRKSAKGQKHAVGAWIKLTSDKPGKILVKVATSFTSIDNARKNLAAEIPGWNFNEVRQASSDIWNQALGQIAVKGNNEKEKVKFYSALYNAHFLPRTFSDVDGSYPRFDGDGQIMKMDHGTYYCDFSQWDTYRAVHPLFSILTPSRNGDMAHSLVLKGQQGAYDDFVLAQVAKKLGKTDDYKALIKRAENYRNVIDPETGYARGRHADGTWIEPFDPFASTSFICEGTPYHYTWYAPQDIAGLIRHMGGKERFINRLDNFFEGNYYWHGNEPGHHIAYLFAYAGEPWKTQKWVHDIINREYFTTPDGLSGNDDAGQMSSWLVFSMVGFYPVCPGMPYYVIGSPSFEESVITLENGKKFTIEAPGASDKNIYIQSATLNGQPYDKSYILHTDIMNGGKLSFVMGDSPNKEWASSAGSLPPSMGL